jgi:hypothetical protein
MWPPLISIGAQFSLLLGITDAIVITKIMFRWIICGSGAVKEYFFVKQDLKYRLVTSKRPAPKPTGAKAGRHLDGTIAELPVTTCRSAGWGVAV